MTGLSRCGRRYPTFDEAYRAAEARSFKGPATRVIGCEFGEHWHLVPLAKVTVKPKRYRPDPFPPMVARLIDARDGGECQGCGSTGRLERHHRRAKASGGSKARAHAQCPCNALSLCRRCHDKAHLSPRWARDLGLIVSQSVSRPGSAGVIRHVIMGDPAYRIAADEFWATCDGRWVHSPMEAED